MAGPDIVYELFNVYAEWQGNRGGLPWARVKKLLCEMDVLEGVPAALVSAYVREIMLRADQDQDGLLSCQEFMVWVFSEGCALLPFRHLGAPHVPLAPLYNRFLYLCQRHRPPGAYRKVTGMTHAAFMEMCQDLGWFADARLQRKGVQLAIQGAVASRVQGNMEGGTRLQFTAFLLALQHVAARRQCGWDAVIFAVLGDGTPPPPLLGHGSNDTYRRTTLKAALPLLVESPGEAPLRWTSQACGVCGKEHSMWIGVDPAIRELLRDRHAPHLHLINTRNVRAAFHRYCLRFNKGFMPLSYQANYQTAPAFPRDDTGEEDGGQDQAADHGDPWGASGFPSCSCNYKQLSLMELQTFWRIAMDNKTLWTALQPAARTPVLEPPNDARPRDTYDPMVPERIEAAFMAACSVAGVYCGDRGAGIHDRPLVRPGKPHGMAAASKSLSAPRPYGAPFSSSSIRASTLRASSARACTGASTATQTNFRASFGSMTCQAPQGPKGAPSAAMELAGNFSPGAGLVPPSDAHRPPVPRLSFPQFLEALRLLAEDMKGHPQDLPLVERNLACILHDLVHPGCPLPDTLGFAWTQTGRQARAKFKITGSIAAVDQGGSNEGRRREEQRGQAVSPCGGARSWR